MLDALDVLRENLAPRYDVEREIGAGGMARVYLAVEQHPHRRVAIKVLDPELSTRLLRERFIREVDLASKLSHPHIVPIFSAGEAAGLFYYVMPYVEGESLRHRLRRDGALALDDALHIARDVADALAFAHVQGIIHRDIKPENILLAGSHAIVADFGIARAISAAGALTLTQTGQSIGSPGYMSPEQAMGLPTDARSDVYSLGCVLFEMLAGQPASPSLSERLIHNWSALESGPALRGAPAGTARAVKHAVSRALAPVPDDRFATAAEFAAALGGAAHRASAPTRGPLAGRRGRLAAALGLGGIVLAAGALVLRRPAAGLNQRRVVVAVIENRTGDPALDNLGHMAADWVTQGLAQTGLVEVVPSVSVMTSSRGQATDVRGLGRATGAGTVVSGGFYRQRDSVRFQIQVAAASDGRVLRALDPVAAPLSQPLDAIEVIRQRVMTALATLFDARLSLWATQASQPPSFEAYQEFIAGLDRFAQFDPHGAIGHFTRAAAVDTAFRLPLLFAANAYMDIGGFAAADSLAHVVARHTDRLAPLDRHYLAWVLAICRGDAEGALRSSRAMADVAPASETLYLVAEDAMRVNRPRAAVTALRELDPDRGFTRGWWVYWDDMALAFHMLGDYRAELKEASEGRRRFPATPQMVAAQVRALAALGRADEVARLLSESESVSRDLGWNPADVMLLAAVELRAHGQRTASDAALAQASAWIDAHAGAEAASSADRYRAALMWYVAGRLDDSRREFEGRAARHDAGAVDVLRGYDAATDLDYRGYLGVIAARQGNREQALRVDRALAGITQPYLFGRHTMWRARIHALLGDRETAVALVRDGLSQGYPHMHALHGDIDFEGLRDYQPFQELLRPKD
jgi:tRNA A-37 threonylcarbamoyl transferase component Bud32/TolB-like protein